MKETPIINELGQIQHKCSDICNCDRLLEEPKSNTQGPGLLLHIAARPSLDQGFLWLLPANLAEAGSKYIGVSPCQPSDCFSIPNSILLYFLPSQPSFEMQP